jgi:hypothetical protein
MSKLVSYSNDGGAKLFWYSKTVTALDVVYALKRSGRTLYGFGA